MLIATAALARRVERAEIAFCEATGGWGVPGGAEVFEAAGGRAVFGMAGSPMNKVLGLGLEDSPSDAELDALEAFYARRDAPVQIELCPLAAPDLPRRLIARGYVLQTFENEIARLMPDGPLAVAAGPDVSVAGDGGDEWLRVVCEGFAAVEDGAETGSGDAAADPVELLGHIMRQFTHPAVTRYIARVDDAAAGAGASFIWDAVVGIFGTATAPAYRRRGVQSALVARALDDARGHADLAIATVEPGSTSQRTFERLGFQVIYTRAILVRDLE